MRQSQQQQQQQQQQQRWMRAAVNAQDAAKQSARSDWTPMTTADCCWSRGPTAPSLVQLRCSFQRLTSNHGLNAQL